MTRGESIVRNAKCKHGHRSAMNISAWCDSNKKCTVLKLHLICHIPKCDCQKQLTFTPEQFQLEGIGFWKYNEKFIQRDWKNGEHFH